MNKTFNINLGGFPFVIDDVAYEHLDQYLKSIHRHFDTSEGYEEITSDIENRMAELFHDQMDGQKIVTFKTVESAIAIMGTPEDFGAEPIDDFEYAQEDRKKYRTSYNFKTGKRLYANPDDSIISGVCSGISAYFGIEDPIWIRLFFVLAGAFMGFGIPVYILLILILPKAETAGDRLAMRGEPINVENIAKIIEEEVDNISDKLSELGAKSKKKAKVETELDLRQEMPLRKGYL